MRVALTTVHIRAGAWCSRTGTRLGRVVVAEVPLESLPNDVRQRDPAAPDTRVQPRREPVRQLHRDRAHPAILLEIPDWHGDNTASAADVSFVVAEAMRD
jgi:hypothetical protein